MTPSKILIVDDHALFRDGLRALLSSYPGLEIVGEAADGEDAVGMALRTRPDLILMDLWMPRVDGIEATRQIRKRLLGVKILVVTSSRTEEHVRGALRAGVDGYLLKDEPFGNLIAAIESVRAGRRHVSSAVSGQLIDLLLTGERQHRATNEKVSPAAWDTLTDRERAIMKLVAEGHTNRETAEILSISPKTVEKHRAKVMRKLGLESYSGLVLYALEMGLIERSGRSPSYDDHEDNERSAPSRRELAGAPGLN